ncbi:YfbM family protein [Undibacterium sp. LX40W]|uniref:YfbM family protein n=2 Tax=Undibacterium TaxID=401469 RepID=A0A923HP02_9BURK|nr:YfbM family protein [Undibacterium nitidum]MBC3882889.1 YfbM family protein [Undibacterium nitidum]MBC3893170.1 YfbM family protein [Undibacterium sp. LX40W]
MMRLLLAAFLSILSMNAAWAEMRMSMVAVSPKQVPDLKRSQRALEQVLFKSNAASTLNIGTSWHAIHYLITGKTSSPVPGAGEVIFGGTEIGNDLGFGPAHLFSAEEVKTISDALQAFPLKTFTGRYDVKQMQASKIYPENWLKEGDIGRARLLDYFQQILNFYANAAKNGQAIVFVVHQK